MLVVDSCSHKEKEKTFLGHWREGKEITMKPSKGIVIIRKRWNVVKGLQEDSGVGTQIVNSLQKTSRDIFARLQMPRVKEQKEQDLSLKSKAISYLFGHSI